MHVMTSNVDIIILNEGSFFFCKAMQWNNKNQFVFIELNDGQNTEYFKSALNFFVIHFNCSFPFPLGSSYLFQKKIIRFNVKRMLHLICISPHGGWSNDSFYFQRNLSHISSISQNKLLKMYLAIDGTTIQITYFISPYIFGYNFNSQLTPRWCHLVLLMMSRCCHLLVHIFQFCVNCNRRLQFKWSTNVTLSTYRLRYWIWNFDDVKFKQLFVSVICAIPVASAIRMSNGHDDY